MPPPPNNSSNNPDVISAALAAALQGVAGAGGAVSAALQEAERNIRSLSEALSGSNNVFQATQRVLQTNIGQFIAIGLRLTALGSSAYGVTEAFTGVVPAVDTVTEAFKKVANLSQMLIPGSAESFQVRRYGQIVTLVNEALSFVSATLKFQLEASQKVANSFVELSRQGATFGASIQSFSKFAYDLNVPMQTLAKIAKENAQNISGLGLGFQEGLGIILKESRNIFYGVNESTKNLDNSIVALYGDLESLTSATASFYAQLSNVGLTTRSFAGQETIRNQALRDYLISQKELTSLTGKTAQALKEEEDKRRQNLDYQLKAARLGQEEQRNLEMAMGLATKFFGPAGAKVAEEYFATGGKIMSKSGLEFVGAQNEQSKAIFSMIDGIRQGREGFRKGLGTYFAANKPALEAEARSREDLAEIYRATGGEYLGMISSSSAAFIASSESVENLGKTLDKLEEDRKKLAETLDGPTKAFVESTRVVMQNQVEIDQKIIKQMTDMDRIVTRFTQIQNAMLDIQQDMYREIASVINEIGSLDPNDLNRTMQNLMQRLIAGLGRRLGGDPPAAANNPPPRTAPSPLPPVADPGSPNTGDDLPVPAGEERERGRPRGGRARGGIVNEPTIVGEAGPERLAGDLVFPYDRPVPLQIDWSPLISAMEENNAAARELVALNEDNLRMQRQLLDAVS